MDLGMHDCRDITVSRDSVRGDRQCRDHDRVRIEATSAKGEPISIVFFIKPGQIVLIADNVTTG